MTYEFSKRGIPLPVGSRLPRRTVKANPIFTLNYSSYIIHEETESGWPTIIEVEQSDGEGTAGVAVDYIGSWHENPVDEVDLILFGDEEMWWTIVAYRNLEDAKSLIRTNYRDYGHIELFEWEEVELEEIRKTSERGLIPVIYDADNQSNSAFSIQRSGSPDILAELLGFSGLNALIDRKERIYNRVIPREKRWEKYDTTQFDQLQDIYGSVVDQNNRTQSE